MRPVGIEATAAGAAYLAGLGVGFWESTEELLALSGDETEFKPTMSDTEREKLTDGWKRAVKSAEIFAE